MFSEVVYVVVLTRRDKRRIYRVSQNGAAARAITRDDVIEFRTKRLGRSAVALRLHPRSKACSVLSATIQYAKTLREDKHKNLIRVCRPTDTRLRLTSCVATRVLRSLILSFIGVGTIRLTCHQDLSLPCQNHSTARFGSRNEQDLGDERDAPCWRGSQHGTCIDCRPQSTRTRRTCVTAPASRTPGRRRWGARMRICEHPDVKFRKTWTRGFSLVLLFLEPVVSEPGPTGRG